MICVEMMMARILILMICRLVFYGEDKKPEDFTIMKENTLNVCE